MLDRLSIDALLKSIIATLVAAIIAILGLGAWKSWTTLTAADRIVAVTNASQQVFIALHNLRLDRASSLRDIAADRQFTVLNPKIQNSRAVGIPALTAALTALDAIHFPERPAFAAVLDGAASSLAALHAESVAALPQPKASRRSDLLVEFARESGALIDALDRLSLRLTSLVKNSRTPTSTSSCR